MTGSSVQTSTKAGTVGGTFLCIASNISSGDLIRTVILAAIGAMVSFGISVLLKMLMQGIRKKWSSGK